MLIMTQDRKTLINTDNVITFSVEEVVDDCFEETDVVAVVAVLEKGNLCLGEYGDVKIGASVLFDIFESMARDERKYVMPEE